MKLKKVRGELEESTNEEEKDEGEVNMIENEDVVVIANDEGLIEKKVVDEGDDGVGMGIGEDGKGDESNANDADGKGNTGDINEETGSELDKAVAGREVVRKVVIDAST